MLLAVLLQEVGQTGGANDLSSVSFGALYCHDGEAVTIDGNVQGLTVLAETKALVADGAEDVGQKTDVVLGNTLVLVDLVATLQVTGVGTLVDSVLDLVVGGWADFSVGATVAGQCHGSSGEEKGSGEELHFDRWDAWSD